MSKLGIRKGWKKSALGDIAAISYGYTAKASSENVGPKFLRITDIQDDMVDWPSVPYCPIDEADLKRHKLRDQDIVFARTGATTGKSYLVCDPPESVAASYLIRLRVKDPNISAKFISKYFQTHEYWNKVSSGISGSAQGGFNASKLSELVIPIPPLPEQKRIVAILDEVFEGIDRAIANTEKNLINARELFESYRNSILDQRCREWEETTLGAEIDLMTGFPFKSNQYTESDQSIRLLRGDNIVQGSLRWDDVKKWPESELNEFLSYQLKEGDVVLAMDRPWVKAGLKHAMIYPNDLPCLLVQRTACIRGTKDIENRFLMYLIGSHAFIRHILSNQTGIGVPHISGKQIQSFRFRKPPLSEQNFISNNLDKLRLETQRLESIYRQKLAALNELKQSILQKAFTGELTADTANQTIEAAEEEIAA
jgi:type I restriction enzyme, S subunit